MVMNISLAFQAILENVTGGSAVRSRMTWEIDEWPDN